MNALSAPRLRINEAREKRALNIARLRRQAVQLSRELEESFSSSPGEHVHVRAMIALRSCTRHSVARIFHDGAADIITGPNCKNKVCPICNQLRAKRLRAGYIAFFERHPELREAYDFMHLTLTLPHTEKEELKEVYQRVITAFNALRKHRSWAEHIAAAIRNIETTRGDSGYHVHIHALLLVYPIPKSRNHLHSWIVPEWNRVTIDPTKPKRKWQAHEIEAREQSFAYVDDPKLFRELVDGLDSRGAVLVGLNSLYYRDKRGRRRYVSKRTPFEKWIRGVLETLKYHFEPFAFRKDNGDWDVEMVRLASSGLYRKQMHARLGEFYGKGLYSQELKDLLNDEIDDTLDLLAGEVIHPETGELCDRNQYGYAAIKTSGVHRKKGQLTVGGDMKHLEAANLADAMKLLIDWQIGEQMKTKSKHLLK